MINDFLTIIQRESHMLMYVFICYFKIQVTNANSSAFFITINSISHFSENKNQNSEINLCMCVNLSDVYFYNSGLIFRTYISV